MNEVTRAVNVGEGADAAGSAYSRTLGNGLRVLELLRGNAGGLGVHAIATALGIHRTAVYRLLGTLRTHDLVTQDAHGRYRLGIGLLELAGTVRGDLRQAATAPLSALADEVGATAFLTVAEHDEAVSVCVVEPPRAQLHVSYRLGTRHPLTVSAAGIAILAGRPPVAGERTEVGAARRCGYAVTSGELEPGAWGLASPLPSAAGHADASVGVVALAALDTAAVASAVNHTGAVIVAHSQS